MFVWSFHAHPTPSHPFRLPCKYIPLLLRYAPILVEFGPCCYPTEYLPRIRFPGTERKLSEEANDIFYMEIEERIMRLISDDDEEEELKRRNGAPPLSINGEKPQLFPRSANDIFYMEIEERIMRIISDDDEEEELKKKNGAPPLPINGEKPQLFPWCDSFIDASCYGSLDTGMRQWQAPFGSGNWQKSAWATYEMNKVRRSALASGRKRNGSFYPEIYIRLALCDRK